MDKELIQQESRIIALEIKFTHQEELLEQLNKIVTKHEFTIDKLCNEIAELKLAATADQSEITNEKPPHY